MAEMNMQTQSFGGRRVARAIVWVGLALGVACAAAELLSGLGYRFGWWSFREGIAVMRVAGWSALGAFAVSLIGVIAEGAARDRLRVGFVALVISALALGFPAYYYYQVQHLPRIHDISTDTQNPPAFVAVLPARQGAENKTDYSPQTAEQQKEGYPDIAPARHTRGRVYGTDRAVVHAKGHSDHILHLDRSGEGSVFRVDTHRLQPGDITQPIQIV